MPKENSMGDWLPHKRVERLAMARKWIKCFADKGKAWEITKTEIDQLTSLTEKTEKAFKLAQSAERTKAITAVCIEAFQKLTDFMRELKRCRLTTPPLITSDLPLLGLRPRDKIHTPIPVPMGQATATVTYHGPHLLRIGIRPVEGTLLESGRKYGFRIHYGILSPEGASAEGLGSYRYLTKTPKTGDELPSNKFTRRRFTMMDFSAEDSGKTAFFCICLENPSGDRGPWGSIVMAVIP